MVSSVSSEIEDLKLQLKNEQNYNNYLTDLYDNIKGFKHDFDNIMNCIGGYIKAEDMNGLKDYFSELEKNLNIAKNIGTLNPNLINNPAIYNLISTKYEKAKALNIDFNIEVFFDFSNIIIPIYDFSKILGIFLDNAIEASKNSVNRQINLCFRESIKNNLQIISIENTYLNKDLDKAKIFQKGISSKKGHYGIGLWEVNQILSKYDNIMLNTTINDNYFKQELQINKDYLN